jgi:hypothetical protein
VSAPCPPASQRDSPLHHTPTAALAWRPDGKQLAVGHADGALAVLSPEDGETLHTSPYQSGAIAALSWTQCAQEEDAPLPHGLRSGLEDRAPRLFEPPLPAGAAAPAGAPAGYAHRLGRRDTLAWPPRPARLDALVAVAADGEVTAYADGLHPMLASGPPAAEAHPVVRVLAVGQPPSLREIVVLVEDSRGALALRGLGSAALGARAGALRAAAALAADVLAGAGRLAAAAAAAVGEWEAGLAAQAELTGTLEALLADHGIDSDATADLLLLVTMGEYSAAMEQFLSTALGEAGLKRAARVVDAALCAVHAAVVDRVAPEAELAAFRLGELRGLAMAPQWRDHLHLKVSAGGRGGGRGVCVCVVVVVCVCVGGCAPCARTHTAVTACVVVWCAVSAVGGLGGRALPPKQHRCFVSRGLALGAPAAARVPPCLPPCFPPCFPSPRPVTRRSPWWAAPSGWRTR